MGFLDVAGELFGFSDSKKWALAGDDPKFAKLTFEGQFTAQNYKEGGGDIAFGETNTVNSSAPNLQFLNNDKEFASFQSRFFATNSLKSVKTQIELLRSFRKRDPDLKRPPKFFFTYGTEIGFVCFVRKVEFLYDELRSDGSIRGSIANITLEQVEPERAITKAAATSLAAYIKTGIGIVAGVSGIVSSVKNKVNIPGGSFHTIDRTVEAKEGDTYELIAQREYGEPMYGDILRRAQPDKANLKIADKVILIDPTEITQIEVTPQSIALKKTPEGQALREEFFQLRDRKTKILV